MLFDARTDEIVQNVRELSRLDPEYGFVFFRARLVWFSSMAHAFHVSAGAVCFSVEQLRRRYVWRRRQMSRHIQR